MQCRWVWLGCGFLAVNGNGVLHYAVQVGVVGVWFSCCQW